MLDLVTHVTCMREFISTQMVWSSFGANLYALGDSRKSMLTYTYIKNALISQIKLTFLSCVGSHVPLSLSSSSIVNSMPHCQVIISFVQL